MSTEKIYTSFWDFYPYYLTEHARPINRAMHFVGTALVIACFIFGILCADWRLFVAMPLCGYGFAWFAGSFLMGILYEKSILWLVMFSILIQLISVPLLIWVMKNNKIKLTY